MKKEELSPDADASDPADDALLVDASLDAELLDILWQSMKSARQELENQPSTKTQGPRFLHSA
jgi:hypothetical protein